MQTETLYLESRVVAQLETASGTTTVRYLHTDALGSPVASSGSAGQLLERTHYEPYGKPINRTVDGVGYTGHKMDGDTGLSYMQQRYMDPQLGVFLSVDPVTAHENPVGMSNRYRYTASNPYRFKDPDGRCYTSTGACMTEAEFEQAWKGEPSRVLNTIGSPLGTVADALNGDFKGMIVDAVLSRAPGGGKAAGFFVRFGKGAESAESLAAQAVKAEKAGFPHGVSVKAQERVSAADRVKHRVADQAEAKSAFNTPQTGNNPNHHAVELPKPVTEKVAQKFNEVYK
ncbi:TPA: RHS repeat-associated core domain-containing protein [Stenotrophomonas maltophilia]|nr:RHS repeat-associated core domain-containing protein [Stenotrophomonas maltophilia]